MSTSNCNSSEDDDTLNEGAVKAPQWVQNQSTVLDEVDQLVELMTVEKTTLTQKISKLEEEKLELHEHGILLENENSQLKSENSGVQNKLLIQQEQSEEVIVGIKEALELAKSELKETRSKVDDLTSDLHRSKDICIQLSDGNLELEEKLKRSHSENWSKSKSLEVGQSASKQISHQLSVMRQQCRALYQEKHSLETRTKELHDKLKNAEGVVMAMKGRANNSRKYERELKLKCSSLEKALEVVSGRSPTVIKVQSDERTREELRLMEECRKKEEAVTHCVHELTVNQDELKKSRLQICKLEKMFQTEKLKNKELSDQIQVLKTEMEAERREMSEKLIRSIQELRVHKDHEFNLGKMEVERSLRRIEDELREAKEEINSMKMKVRTKEGKWREEGRKWKQERIDFIKVRQEIMEKKEGGTCCHGDDFTQLREAKEDYRRLKAASTKRCTELAKEVWRLESILQDMHNKQ